MCNDVPQVDPLHTPALVGLALQLQAAAVRERDQGKDATQTAAKLAEAEVLLCRVLTTDACHGPALMAVAEMLWHPQQRNTAHAAESIYRRLLLATSPVPHASAPPAAAPRTAASSLVRTLAGLVRAERAAVSFNLALLLTRRGVDIGNRAACVEAQRLLSPDALPSPHHHSAPPASPLHVHGAPQGHAGVEILRGRLLMWRKEPAAAEECFRRVLGWFPAHVDARLRLAQVLSESVWTAAHTHAALTAAQRLNVTLNRWKNKASARCFGTWATQTQDLRAVRAAGRRPSHCPHVCVHACDARSYMCVRV